jgi:hypothetical protein
MASIEENKNVKEVVNRLQEFFNDKPWARLVEQFGEENSLIIIDFLTRGIIRTNAAGYALCARNGCSNMGFGLCFSYRRQYAPNAEGDSILLINENFDHVVLCAEHAN